jgi:hypothetical protein
MPGTQHFGAGLSFDHNTLPVLAQADKTQIFSGGTDRLWGTLGYPTFVIKNASDYNQAK